MHMGRFAGGASVGLLLAGMAAGQTNRSLQGVVTNSQGSISNIPSRHFDLTIPAAAGAAREASMAGHRITTLKAVVDLPAGFDPRRPWPVLLVCAPSGSTAVAAERGYANIALAQGWVVTAVDGPKVEQQQDTNVFAWEMISCLLYYLRNSWPQSKQWPFATAGFSGGAKRAAMVAAEMSRRHDAVIGVFMGGMNEDRATLGYRVSQPGGGFLNVPMFLSNGTRDPIAGPSYGEAIKESMLRFGFRNVRNETYEGQHHLNTNQLKMALEWFRPRPEARPQR